MVDFGEVQCHWVLLVSLDRHLGQSEKWNECGILADTSIRIKCNDYPNAYLCNAHGYKEHNTQVYVWPKEVHDSCYTSYVTITDQHV